MLWHFCLNKKQLFDIKVEGELNKTMWRHGKKIVLAFRISIDSLSTREVEEPICHHVIIGCVLYPNLSGKV